MAVDLAVEARERGIRYFMISYTDLFGAQRAKLVPAAAIADMEKDGAGFAGFATWLDMTPAHPDLFAMPDPSSLIQLPWKQEVAWVAADPYMDGKQVAQAPARRPEEDGGEGGRSRLCREDRRRMRVLPGQPRRRGDLRRVGYRNRSLATTSRR